MVKQILLVLLFIESKIKLIKSMRRQNRVYEDNQVGFDGCLCPVQAGANVHNNQSDSHNLIAGQRPIVSKYYFASLAHKKLKLAKHLQPLEKLPNSASPSGCISNPNGHRDIIEEISSPTPKYPGVSAPWMQNTGLRKDGSIAIYPSPGADKYFLGCSLSNQYKNTQLDWRVYLSDNSMDEDAKLILAEELRLILDCKSTKINQTSSTTLFETKKHHEDLDDRRLNPTPKLSTAIKPSLIQYQGAALEMPLKDRASLSFVDFSQVREVETVNSDSFDMSFIDQNASCEAEFMAQHLSLEMEIKRLLSS